MKLVLVMMQANLKQLVFFWVEKYRNLENVGVNFGSEFIFQVQYSHGAIQIEKEGNGKYVNNFFLSETDNKVNNISAIIGENGCGKSNLLAALRIALSHNWGNYNLSIKDSKFLLIFKTNVGFGYISNAEVITDTLVPLSYDDLAVIYYSPIIDFSNYSPGYPSFKYDVSSNVLLSEEYLDVQGFRFESKDPILFHKHQDTWRQINFVQNLSKTQRKAISELIRLPEKVTISTYLSGKVNKEHIPVELNSCFEALLNKFRDSQIDDVDNGNYTGSSLYQKLILEQYITNLYLCFDIEYPQWNFPLNDILNVIVDKAVTAEKGFEILLEELSSKRELNLDVIPILEFWKKLKSLLEHGELIDHRGVVSTSFKIPVAESKDLMILYMKYLSELNKYRTIHSHTKTDLYYNFGFMDLDWHELSSGEKSYLNLFSRLYWARELISRAKERFKDNLLFLIDEGEAGFHLQWQKDYINNLMQVISEIFTLKKGHSNERSLNIQIIFVSHSPFSLSDLPNYNIVYLKSGRVLQLEERPPHSFAANIHNLMTHSFFLKDGLVGQFAIKKINALIKLLNSEEESDKMNMEKVIAIIDEPILKQQLLSMYTRKYGKEKEKRLLRQQIDELQEKLNKLS